MSLTITIYVGINEGMGWREKLKAAREARRLSQVELANQLNLSQSAVARWEKGPNKPDVVWLIQLAKVLAFDVAWLLNDERPDDPPSVQELAVRTTFEKVLALNGSDETLAILLRGSHHAREYAEELGRVAIKPSRTDPSRRDDVVAADRKPLPRLLPRVRVPLRQRHQHEVELDDRPARSQPVSTTKLRRKK
jgi:transcriptional regulator with XRE-family HTH domain